MYKNLLKQVHPYLNDDDAFKFITYMPTLNALSFFKKCNFDIAFQILWAVLLGIVKTIWVKRTGQGYIDYFMVYVQKSMVIIRKTVT